MRFFRSPMLLSFLAFLFFASLAMLAGCNIIEGVSYMVSGNANPAKTQCLSGETVVVICLANTSSYGAPTGDKEELQKKISLGLGLQGEDIHVISDQRVESFIQSYSRDHSGPGFDLHSASTLIDVGNKLGATRVLVVRFEELEVKYNSKQELAHGIANGELEVLDCKTTEVSETLGVTPLYQEDFQVSWPSGGQPTWVPSQKKFEKAFYLSVTNEIFPHFCPFLPHENVAGPSAGVM